MNTPNVVFKTRFIVPKHISKKNMKRIGVNSRTKKPFIMKESKAAFVEQWLVQKLSTERFKQRIDTIHQDINAKFTFIYPKSIYFTKAGHRSNKVLDTSNSYQIYEDALTKSQIIIDDRIICSHDGSRRLPHDGNEYFIEIELTLQD